MMAIDQRLHGRRWPPRWRESPVDMSIEEAAVHLPVGTATFLLTDVEPRPSLRARSHSVIADYAAPAPARHAAPAGARVTPEAGLSGVTHQGPEL